MQTGTVKWFNRDRGFGFVTADNGEDLFIHCRDIAYYDPALLLEGDRIEFEAKQTYKGLRAVNARLL